MTSDEWPYSAGIPDAGGSPICPFYLVNISTFNIAFMV